MQLEAVKQNGCAIQYIDNPSEAVKLEAVKQKARKIKRDKKENKKNGK